MEHDSSDHLHIVVAHAKEAAAPFAANSERLDEQVVERLSLLQARAKASGLFAELLVGEVFVFVFELIDRIDARLQALDIARVGGAEDRC
jgi:hypothetical protein